MPTAPATANPRGAAARPVTASLAETLENGTLPKYDEALAYVESLRTYQPEN